MHASQEKRNTHAATPREIKTLADRLLEVTAKIVSDTLGNVKAEALVNKFAARKAKI